ncbi:unnamed protein product [Kuraishia capsulata CBS 1993]|uniref:HIT-type domain-containing protein n=1 Tax=Kuraishia capsulata CBS 1993 TaxID=1382522 RepID=W6MH71_9ASCO|nr:uncharacterized protein KUCA_T00000955001 [Kuraishia capsulata CBS 1993]CDK24988.1 unnamed protein product [Kuraishia capsulata CBS 1993]
MSEEEAKCCICHLEKVKYKCPACLRKTCSAKCVGRHKLQFECSGKADPTKYQPKPEIRPETIQRDYNFLLDVGRRIDLSKRDAHTGARAMFIGDHNRRRQFGQRNDVEGVVVTRGVNVRRSPIGMSRSKTNKSGFDKRKNVFAWTVQWLLVDEELNVTAKAITHRLNETAFLGDSVPLKPLGLLGVSDKGENTNGEAEERKQLHFYFKDQKHPKNVTFTKLDGSCTLMEVLKGKTVIDFPDFYVTESDTVSFNVREENATDNDSSEDSDSSSDSSSSSDTDSSSDEEDISEEDTDVPEESSSKHIPVPED